jgi:hypothetical protein
VEGYRPPFTSPPPLSCPGEGFSTPLQGANNHLIDVEVEAMLSKGAIEEVPLLPPPPSFISTIFLVKTKNGGMRPVINLKRLNAAHLDTPHFRMETPQDVRYTIRPGDWAASIDLRDAYFHVLIHPADRKYLCFGWRGRLFQFRVLPFGLSPVPPIFTLLTKKIKAKLGRLGICSIFYLNDILILGTSFLNCQANLQRALSILMEAGFLINWEKSCIIPTRHQTYP